VRIDGSLADLCLRRLDDLEGEQGSKKLWPGLRDLQETKVDPDSVDFSELKQRLLDAPGAD
jgi:hypothetical protein